MADVFSVDPMVLATILGMGLVTYFTRVAGLVIVRFFTIEGRARAALEAVPAAVLMAVIAPTILATGPAESLAALITLLVAFRLPLWAVVVVGVISVVALRSVFGLF